MSELARKSRVYDDMVADLRQQILGGLLLPDHYLPPERELAVKYEISSRGVREGVSLLEAEGLIRRHQGKGTVVLSRKSAVGLPQSGNVAVIFQGRVRDVSTAEDFDGMQQALQREGFGTTLYVADGNPDKEVEIVQQLIRDNVPGLVLYSAHASSSFAHLQAARDAGMKIVTFDHDFPGLDCNFIGIDDRTAAYDATHHLIRLGCRQLILINSERDWTTHVLREQGFNEAADDWARGLRRDVIRLPATTDFAHRDAILQQQLLAIADRDNAPVGIVGWWDEMAIRAMDMLLRDGWSVPGDVKVIGFANDQTGELAEVPLTTMAIPRAEVALLAASVLISQMRDPSRKSQRVLLPSRMIIRKSCGTYAPQDSNKTASSRMNNKA